MATTDPTVKYTQCQEVENSDAQQDLKQGVQQHASRDIALELVDTLTAGEFTAKEERSTLRRIDGVLVPIMFISFALQYMDKSCLTGAALFGILPDLDLLQM